MKIKGRVISKGFAEGEVIVSKRRFSFLGDVDVESGVVVADDSDIVGERISNKVFVFYGGRGSTVGTYVLLRMKKRGTAPKAIINVETEPVIAIGAIIAGIPLMDRFEVNPLEILESGDFVVMNAYDGFVEIKGRV